MLSRVQLFATRWTPLSMEFSRQEYWNGLPFPSQGIFLTPESNLGILHFRQILYQLSYQGSLDILTKYYKLGTLVRFVLQKGEFKWRKLKELVQENS